MPAIYKLLFFVFIFGLMTLAGYFLFKLLNKKIKGSETNFHLAGYSILLFVVCAVLFFAGLIVLIKSYDLLASSE